jgi:hypothetical protein
VPITVNCPTCGKLLRLPDDCLGKQLRCPSCQDTFTTQSQHRTDDAPARVQPREEYHADSRVMHRPSHRNGYEHDSPSRRSSRHDDDLDNDFDDRPSRRRHSYRNDDDSGFECPFCGSRDRPATRQRISTAGWIVLVVFVIIFWPLFWIGLLIKEDYRACSECGKTLA